MQSTHKFAVIGMQRFVSQICCKVKIQAENIYRSECDDKCSSKPHY